MYNHFLSIFEAENIHLFLHQMVYFSSRLAYGASSSVCSYAAAGDDLCKYLFCNVADTFYGQKCISMKMPPAEGTSCGRGKWCRQGSCVREGGYSSAIDGNWGSWGSWSACPAECGSTGVRVRTRTCSDPAPAYGGLYCRGNNEDTRTCMGEACDTDTYSMFSREDQCKQLQPSYRARSLRALTGTSSSNNSWKPYLTAANYRSCKLQCQSTGDMYDTKVVSTIVADGTSCGKVRKKKHVSRGISWDSDGKIIIKTYVGWSELLL